MQPKCGAGGIDNYRINFLEDNEGAKAVAENPLRPARSKHMVDVK